nr:histone H1.10-like [Marmota flaviventris]
MLVELEKALQLLGAKGAMGRAARCVWGGSDKGRGGPKHKSSCKKNQPVSQVETSAGLASRSLSLVGIYAEARKVEGFNQQNSCTYLKYLVHAANKHAPRKAAATEDKGSSSSSSSKAKKAAAGSKKLKKADKPSVPKVPKGCK